MESLIAKYSLVIIILALLGLLIQGDLFSSSPYVIIAQLVGLATAMTARITFRNHEFKVTADPGSGGLIRRGPYRLIRHPMYAGVLLILIAGVAGNFSALNGAIGFVALVVVLSRISIEERLLRLRYSEYEEYARSTKRLIPFLY